MNEMMITGTQEFLGKTITDIHDMELKEGIDILDLKNCGDYYPPQLENFTIKARVLILETIRGDINE